ncbi:hypothetical protein PseudUWO311_00610 [Pseudanabaena sp. UWO311]|uniref:hypothetical protein n=1 Tax=Pseudanabaena sp. UWO311 TaxID=2487337 RepID=UPI00115B3387|nr:hypothetical protein [Pseudanabaena sp. UWO311]TYQ29432.1 hypothetical protein PseudUWO311_00610 [Pseudanabaena sp. UWO311]
MSAITDGMRQVFIETCRLYQAEREYNYLNYGKYPYRERKNSVQIIADFNENAYSVNGLFTVESEYTQVYPPEIIESIEQVLIGTTSVFTTIYEVIENPMPNESGVILTATVTPELLAEYEIYNTIITRDYVEREAVTIQVVSYAFPFNCVADSLGRLVLSF